jgi:hypothetical protein
MGTNDAKKNEDEKDSVVRLLVFESSPDADDPDCICSLCRRGFTTKSTEDDAEEGTGDDIEEDTEDFEVPIRMFLPAGTIYAQTREMRFHQNCFDNVFVFDIKRSKFSLRKGIKVVAGETAGG